MTTFILRSSPNRLNVVFEGDSLTTGTPSYPSLMMSQVPGAIWNNVAVGGSGLSTINDRSAACDALLSPRRRRNILVLWTGANNQADAEATFMTPLWAYCDARRTAGWRVLLATVMVRGDVNGNATNQAAYNVNIRANWASHVDAIFDIAADARLQDYNNTTYFNADKVHLITAGKQVVADICLPKLLQLKYT